MRSLGNCLIFGALLVTLAAGCSEKSSPTDNVAGQGGEATVTSSATPSVSDGTDAVAVGVPGATDSVGTEEEAAPGSASDGSSPPSPSDLASPITEMNISDGTKRELQNQPSEAERERIRKKVEAKRAARLENKEKANAHQPYLNVPLSRE